jgi:hypothetical protein
MHCITFQKAFAVGLSAGLSHLSTTLSPYVLSSLVAFSLQVLSPAFPPLSLPLHCFLFCATALRSSLFVLVLTPPPPRKKKNPLNKLLSYFHSKVPPQYIMEAAPRTTFLSFLDNWMLLFVTMAFGFYWCKINCIDPKLKELRERDADKLNGHAEKKTQ